MPILAAPLRSLAIIGTRSTLLSSAVTTQALTLLPGFVLLGVPVYYITQRNEDMPRVFGASKNQVELVFSNGGDCSTHSEIIRSIRKQTGRRHWMAGRRD